MFFYTDAGWGVEPQPEPNDVELLGGTFNWVPQYQKRKKEIDKVIERLEEIVDEFKKKPNAKILQNAAAKELKILARQFDFMPRPAENIVTLSQLSQTLDELRARKLQYIIKDDEEVIALILSQGFI